MRFFVKKIPHNQAGVLLFLCSIPNRRLTAEAIRLKINCRDWFTVDAFHRLLSGRVFFHFMGFNLRKVTVKKENTSTTIVKKKDHKSDRLTAMESQ